MIDGRTVMEVYAKSRSAQEVVTLWSYISDRLEKNFRRTVFATPQMANGHMGSRSAGGFGRSEVHTSELQSLMRISYAVFCLKKKTENKKTSMADAQIKYDN